MDKVNLLSWDVDPYKYGTWGMLEFVVLITKECGSAVKEIS